MIDFAIIGGGVSGIITLVYLISKFPKKNFLWIDKDNFNSGDLIHYPEVPANTPFHTLFSFLTKMYSMLEIDKDLNNLCPHPNNIFKLKCLTKELLYITNFLRTKSNITMITEHISKVQYMDEHWILHGNPNIYMSHKVILASGCNQRKLDINIKTIPIQTALNPHILDVLDIKDKKIFVFGNSHSGILVLKNLLEVGYTNVTNIIKTPVKIPYFNEKNMEINQESGIRGLGLKWAKEYLIPTNKTSIKIIYYNDIKHIDADYVIYAIGLSPNNIIVEINKQEITIKELFSNKEFNDTGELFTNLYGIGVAFPEKIIIENNTEYKIGASEFLDRIQKMF